jgi:hypothetical protein
MVGMAWWQTKSFWMPDSTLEGTFGVNGRNWSQIRGIASFGGFLQAVTFGALRTAATEGPVIIESQQDSFRCAHSS